MTRNKAIYVRVTQAEREAIQKAAKACDLSVSQLGLALLTGFAEHKNKPHRWPAESQEERLARIRGGASK